jgi:hypothetical protein
VNLPDTQYTFTLTEGDVLTLLPIIVCDNANSPADSIAQHNKALARMLDIYSASFAAAGGLSSLVAGPAGVIAGTICVVIALFLQFAKDCIGDNPTPKSGVVFNQNVSYTYDQIKGHAVSGSDGRWFWTEELPYTAADNSATTNVFLKLTRTAEYGSSIIGAHGPGKFSPRLGGKLTDWGSPSGMWADAERRIMCKIPSRTAEPRPEFIAATHRMLLHLSSREAAYRSGADPARFSVTAARPIWQISPGQYAPANIETLLESHDVTAQEGSKPFEADLYKGSDSKAWSGPMLATPYSGPKYPSAVTGLGPVVVTVAIAHVAPELAAAIPTPQPSQPPAMQFADTLCLPNSVFLQLYAVHDRAVPNLIFGFQIRYLRYASGVIVTDVMLSPYEPIQ